MGCFDSFVGPTAFSISSHIIWAWRDILSLMLAVTATPIRNNTGWATLAVVAVEGHSGFWINGNDLNLKCTLTEMTEMFQV